MKRLAFGIFPSSEDQVSYLPFWRMKAHSEGITLRSFADFVKLTNLPRMVQPEWERQDIYFWSPAFKVNPQLFLRLAQQVTVFQPQTEYQKELPKSLLYPVTLPVSEAGESLKITLAQVAVPQKTFFPRLPEITFSLDESLLVYLPFTEGRTELIQPQLKLTINRNAFNFGKNM